MWPYDVPWGDGSHWDRENPPPFVDAFGNFVAAEFVCAVCGEHINVALHPSQLGDMQAVQQWLDDNAPCKCHTPDPPNGP